jgi:hypothetical protein
MLSHCYALICFTCSCACLHPPSRCRPSSPLIPWVFIPAFSICMCQFVLFVQVNQQFLSFWFSPVYFCPVLLVLTFACPDSEPVCLTTLPESYRTFAASLDFRPVPALICCLPAPCVAKNIVSSTQSEHGSYL